MKIFVKTKIYTSVDQDLARRIYKFDTRTYGFSSTHPNDRLFEAPITPTDLNTHNPNFYDFPIFWVHTESLDRLPTMIRILYEI